MALLDYLLGQRKKSSARAAKDRLQILLAHERSDRNMPDYLPKMRREILQVISKYIEIDDEQLKISIDEESGFDVLELNLVLHESDN